MLTAKHRTTLVDHRLDMDGRLFGFCGNITTSGDDDERVCLAVRVFEVEPAKEDGSSRGYALTKVHFPAHACYHCIRIRISVSQGNME
jgi:hypothetical protein